jgi:ribosome-associated heat shock protein Hsp15
MSRAETSRDDAEDNRVRFDKWLWAARFYKTRSLCAQAIEAGQVRVNGERAKPARNMRVGEAVSIRKSGIVCEVVVTALADRRGNATDAAKLYCETEASVAAREEARAERRPRTAQPRFPGRPTKRQRRKLGTSLNGRRRQLTYGRLAAVSWLKIRPIKAQLHVDEVDQEIRRAVGAENEPSDGQVKEEARRMPENAARKEAARLAGRAVIHRCTVVTVRVSHPGEITPAAAVPATRPPATPARPA